MYQFITQYFNVALLLMVLLVILVVVWASCINFIIDKNFKVAGIFGFIGIFLTCFFLWLASCI